MTAAAAASVTRPFVPFGLRRVMALTLRVDIRGRRHVLAQRAGTPAQVEPLGMRQCRPRHRYPPPFGGLLRLFPSAARTCAASLRNVGSIVLFGFLALLAASSVSHAAEYQRAPTPDWVTPVAVAQKFQTPTAQISDGAYYLLGDYQTRIDDGGEIRYRHFAVKALSETGVDSIANLEVDFDPSYETLTWHSLAVIRNGRRVSRLDTAKVRILEREPELDYRIFDGSKSAHLFLEDIRVGDIIEYSYSLRGSNPVFGRREFGSIPLQWDAPIQHLYARLLFPDTRAIAVVVRNTGLSAQKRDVDHFNEYVWDQFDLPPLLSDDDAPGWFDSQPEAQWNEFADWHAVAQWAIGLYTPPASLGAELEHRVALIKANPEPSERLLAALRLVQRDVRYMGVEIGPDSYAPSAPDLVYQRRFGDCKDKTLLLLSLLRKLGIDAEAALVNTDLVHELANAPATPAAFNHVIVRARLGANTYWLDPTRSVQLSRLDRLFQPDFGYALLVEPGTHGLTAMTTASPRVRTRNVRTTIDARAGIDKPANYTVTTITEGENAELARDQLASSSRDDLQRKYLNFYAGYYPGIRMASPMTVEDDVSGNRLTTVEHYQIPDFWPHSAANKRREAHTYSPDMAEYLNEPSSTARHSPIALAYPTDFTLDTEILLPDSWPISPDSTRIDDSHFSFEQDIQGTDKRVVLHERYRTLADNVLPADMENYVAKLDSARNTVGYFLYQNDTAPKTSSWDRFNWMVAMLTVLLLAVFAWLARRLYRYDPPPYSESPDPRLTGFGGWLILPCISVVSWPPLMLYQIIKGTAAFAMPTWISHTHPGDALYHPMWAPSLLFELSAQTGLFVLSVLLLIVFFQRRRIAPLLFISLELAALLVGAIDLGLLSAIPNIAEAHTTRQWMTLARVCVRVVVWCPYFLLSKRVRYTFTRRWRQAPPPIPDSASLPEAVVS
jgi:transglutaminase-like putative cysteine protease